MFYTIENNNETKLIEKKSVFIANLYYVETEEVANLLIKQIEKKYYDAKHHCFAYRLQNNGDIVERFSDNGEPSGTAGMPILGILRGKELTNVLVVVTRYFGGILLGTGGLVRAYADSAKQVLEEVNIVKKDTGLKLMYEIQYNDLEKLKYFLRQNNIKVYNIEYFENIQVYVEITDEKVKKIQENENELNFKILNTKIIQDKCAIVVE